MSVVSLETLRLSLPALERLNSFVRWRDGMEGGGYLKRPVYFFKIEAIRAGIEHGIVTQRAVQTYSKCHSCSGSGIWQSDYRDEGWPCRSCGATGIKHLRFLETVFADGPKWHTPFDKAFSTSIDKGVSWDACQAITDWEPNTRGGHMCPDAVAGDMLLVERLFPQRPGRRTVWYQDSCCGDVDDFDYLLAVGRITRRCSFCGVNDEPLLRNYGISRSDISWTDCACTNCADLAGLGIFERFREPAELVNKPNIVAWRNARLARKTCAPIYL